MNLRKIILSCLPVLLLVGCQTRTQPVDLAYQSVLDALLPPNFRGNASLHHKNPYFDVDIRAGGLRRTPGPTGKWEFEWLVYRRNDRVTLGEIRLGNPPNPL